MNKKEILEIRKLLSKDNCRIDRICSCYVDGHKEKKATMNQSFLTIPDEEMFKYCDVFKKTLSGTLGKNLINLSYSLDEELTGDRQKLLLALRDSELKDEALLDVFYDKMIDTYIYAENYLIILVHGMYDIPKKSSNNEEEYDASDYVYSFLLCSVCPVNLSKAGLMYDGTSNSFVDKIQDWMLCMPDFGFLYPAFNDRNTDIHSLLYYSKNAGALHSEITDEFLGVGTPTPAADQKVGFNVLVEETFGEDCTFEVVKNIHENLLTIMEEKKEDPDPATLDQRDVRILLENSGAKEEHMETFEEEYAASTGDQESMMASNLTNTRSFEVKMPDITVKVSPDRTDLIETRTLEDGREYLVIPFDEEIEVNGIRIHPAKRQ
ncbi:MAG: DUF4317 domain-containing protein [Lachnospiraceae bacterium]|nr:DUF4317 domain-containing protein [Lachnospiraceae bacterium]